MWHPEWNVLVVDDEPDVLQLSKLVMNSIEVDGVPIRIHTASSKAEAIELLQTEFMEENGPGTLAAAFIDVVMETDHAGLELCDFIRNTMGNNLVSLFVRTGQPGTAPEREVIDKYNISGYFTKVEATEDKLYTFVKSGIRQYMWAEYCMTSILMTTGAVMASQGGQGMITQMMTDALEKQRENRGYDEARFAIIVENEPVTTIGTTTDDVFDLIDKMDDENIFRSLPDGIEYGVIGHDTLIRMAATPYSPATIFYASTASLPFNDMMVMTQAQVIRTVGVVWKQAGQRVPQ